MLSQKLGSLVALGLLMPAIAVGARRPHDNGHSGWWSLIGAIPVIGNLVLLFWAVQPPSRRERIRRLKRIC